MRGNELVYAAGGKMRDCRCTESSLESEEEEREASGAAAEWAGEEAGASPRGVCKAQSFHPQSKAPPAEGSQIRGGGVRGPAHGRGAWGYPDFHPDQRVGWSCSLLRVQECKNELLAGAFGFLARDCISLPPCSVCGTWVSSSQWRLEGLCAASMQQKWNLERKTEFFRSLETKIFTITLLSYELNLQFNS